MQELYLTQIHIMLMRSFICLILLLSLNLASAQKKVYIPNEWKSGNFDYSFQRSAQSDNFIIFWGPLAGSDPRNAPSDIAFDPAKVLDTAEELYDFYIDSLRFLSDTGGLLSEWKMILVMLHTWQGVEGWAFGGNYDGTTGAMWMHPHAASDGPTLAHEFTHALQNYTWMMFPGHSFVNHDYVGFFWETHAEFMAMQRYPDIARHFDMARWLNTSQFHWSSTRHHYQAFIFLQFVKEQDGLELIHRMWRESIIGEHPLETYMRLTGRGQQELNDLFGRYAMKNVHWDYGIGDLLRDRIATLPEVFTLNPSIIPDVVDKAEGLYQIQDHRAPQDYGYNHIRLHPVRPDSCDETIVQIRFRGYGDAAEDAGWRWGLVAIDDRGNTRYSEMLRDDGEMEFRLEEDEKDLYLVVSGAPDKHHNYAWEAGFPRIWRYPYAFRLRGAFPEGHQPGYTRVPEGVAGAPHPNGGGFVAATASVAATAYVAPGACVLDRAELSGMARLEGHALVKHNARVGDNAIVGGYATLGEDASVMGQAEVSGHAWVFGGNRISGKAKVKGHSVIFGTQVYDQALVEDNTFCWGAELYGTVKLGGDAEYFRPCSAGTYLQVQGAYGRDCDGLDVHPANVYLNTRYALYDAAQLMYAKTPDCGLVSSHRDHRLQPNEIRVFPVPFDEVLVLENTNGNSDQAVQWQLFSPHGEPLYSGTIQPESKQEIKTGQLPAGMYHLHLKTLHRVETRRLVRY